MAAPISIGALDAGEAGDLAQALAARGVTGVPVESSDGRWLEVRSSREETHRLVAELRVAVGVWLSERGRDTVELRVGDRVEAVRARGDLPGALHSRVARARRHGD